jgi:hypothetical protein
MPAELGRQGHEGTERTGGDGRTMATDLAVGGSSPSRRRGERRTARQLRPLLRAGRTVLHDLAIPQSRANGDHLLIGPPECSWSTPKPGAAGRITLAVDGSAWHNGHPLDQTLATVRWEAQQLAHPAT